MNNQLFLIPLSKCLFVQVFGQDVVPRRAQKAIVLLTLWLTTLAAWAEDVFFTVSAPQSVTIGHQFQVDYSVNHEGHDLQVPSMEDFEVLKGPSTSRSSCVQWINGKMSNSTELRYTFVLLPFKIGTFTLAPATIQVEGKKYSTQPLTIKVIDEGQPGATATQGGLQTGGASGNATSSSSTSDKADQVFVRVFAQDVVPRQAPIDNMSSIEDSMKNDEGDSSKFTEIPIIIDSNEGWEWIGKEESENVFEAYPLRLSYNKYKSHPQYRVIGAEVYNEKGQLVRVVDIFDYNRRPISQRVTDELLRQTYINDYKTNKYNFKKENQNAQNYVKQELKLITSSRFYWSKEGVGYLQQLNLDHADDFDILLKIERLNDTSFKLIFGDVKGNSVSTWKVAYLSNGQYKSKIIATCLPLEKIKVRIRVYELEFKNGKLTIHED